MENIRDASSLFRRIHPEELVAIAKKHFASNILREASCLNGGFFNTIYKLTLSDGKRYILRVAPDHEELLLPIEVNRFQGAAMAHELFIQHNIPIPKVICVCDRNTVINRAYMITEYVDGISLLQAEHMGLSTDECYKEVGKYTRLIHGIAGHKFGRLSEIACGGGYSSWKEAILSEFAGWEMCSRRFGIFSKDEYNSVKHVIDKSLWAFEDVTVPYLVHKDIWSSNIIVRTSNTGCSFASFIDADDAAFGDMDFDFPCGNMINNAFQKGYIRQLNKDKASERRRKIYALLSDLQAVYKWSCQYHQEKETSMHRKQANKLIAQLIED